MACCKMSRIVATLFQFGFVDPAAIFDFGAA
jgi:hypothetical protein